MLNHKRVKIFTTVVPDQMNRGGPSGLLWEIVRQLEGLGYEVVLEFIHLSENFILRKLQQLGFIFSSNFSSGSLSDFSIFYPFYLSLFRSKRNLENSIVLGPDATSLLFARLLRNSRGLKKFNLWVLKTWFLFCENLVASRVKLMVVVGRTDVLWLRSKSFLGNSNFSFLVHPVLSSNLNTQTDFSVECRPRLVFAGDLSQKYVGDFFNSEIFQGIASFQRNSFFRIVVVGKNNYWFWLLLNKVVEVEYIEWIDDYRNLCSPWVDIHVFPLFAGAGTKNRTLTAVANDLVVVGTPIALENVSSAVLTEADVFKFVDRNDFFEALKSAALCINDRRSNDLFTPRNFYQTINEQFQDAFCDIIGLISVEKER